jgi:formate hydrogenlyase transcriptional activator
MANDHNRLYLEDTRMVNTISFPDSAGLPADRRRLSEPRYVGKWNGSNEEFFRHGIIGTSKSIMSVVDQIRLVAPTDSTVLIQGETGTGKELFAQAIHNLSPRCRGPFVTLNCAAMPAGLLESELFGHERGAFTGAMAQRIGRFEMANGGTLFLDEIGDMALDLQAKLLRVLQERSFERLGSTRTSSVNVRVIAATNRDLLQMAENKEFRSDLFYRLSVFPLSLPPLRERREDIPALVRHFVAKYSERMNKVIEEIPPSTIEAMMEYDWPGNVRQLQNFVEHGVIVSQEAAFQPALEQLQRRKNGTVVRIGKTLEDATRDHILETLKDANWIVGGRHGAAARLGLARTTLLSKMRRLGIEAQASELVRKASPMPQAFASAG